MMTTQLASAKVAGWLHTYIITQSRRLVYLLLLFLSSSCFSSNCRLLLLIQRNEQPECKRLGSFQVAAAAASRVPLAHPIKLHDGGQNYSAQELDLFFLLAFSTLELLLVAALIDEGDDVDQGASSSSSSSSSWPGGAEQQNAACDSLSV